jgi:hypothetical protein
MLLQSIGSDLLGLETRTLWVPTGLLIATVMVFLLIAERCVLFLEEQAIDASSDYCRSERQVAVNCASILLS